MTSPDSYTSVSVVGNSIMLDSSTYNSFGVQLTDSVSTINICGAAAQGRTQISVVFYQSYSGGKSVSFPSNVILPIGIGSVIDTTSYRATSVRIFTVNGGAIWFLEKMASYDCTPAPVFSLPVVADDYATFNDEGDSATGWVPLNGACTSSYSAVHYTKPALGMSWICKNAPRPPQESDIVLYARVRTTSAPNSISVLHFYDPASGRIGGIWIGSANGTTIPTQGAISLAATTSNGAVRNTIQIASGVDYQNFWLDFALHWDSVYSTMNCYFRESDGRWKFKGRVQSEYVGGTDIYAQFTPDTPAGSFMDIDFITIGRPNFMVVGDSVAAGATLFEPNPAYGLINDESTWMRHAKNYSDRRNNLIVNKGKNGYSSAQTLSRMAQINASAPRVVFLHGPTNDWAQNISQADSQTNMQTIVSSANAAGAQVVLLNQIYCSSTTVGNTPTPVRRDYGIQSWANLSALTGVSARIDVMYALKDANLFIDQGLAQSDGHPNIAGYTAMGALISQ